NQRIAAMSGESEDDEPIPDAVDMEPAELRGAIEALLLVAGKPISVERLAGCLPGVSQEYVGGILEGLAQRYSHEQRGWDLRRLAGGWQLLTRPSLHPWVRQLNKTELPTRLSRSAMETLAIVAYKQPVTRGDIEDIRGVQCGPMLRQLMDLKLVQVVGRHEDAIGRPMLYGTTSIFLDRFGLGDIGDLPRRHEFGD
ncbi:MAG: SMC-Scp complex subunit ScpB, partial [Planctomycetota bacterium]